MSDTRSVVEVSGPAAAVTVRVFRSVAAGIAAHAGMTMDAIDECKIVVDEAATMLLRAGSPQTLFLSLEPTGTARIRAKVGSDADPEGWPGDRERSWPWRVIAGLASSARCTVTARGPAVVFEMDRGSTSA